MSYIFAILKNGLDDTLHERWVTSCKNMRIDFDVINIFESNWLENLNAKPYNCVLLRPPGLIEKEKVLFDERLYIISKVLRLQTYPSYEEVIIYENKKILSDYLKAMHIPHPKTAVILEKDEAFRFLNTTTFPIVGKTSIGASGSGVSILKTKREAIKYVSDGFSYKGVKTRFGPNRTIGTPGKWTKKTVNNPQYFLSKLKSYYKRFKNRQKDFIIFQEYIPHDHEWRAVKIGKSYFAHKKIKDGDKASGTKGIEFDSPPESLLDFIRELSLKTGFSSMSFDLFNDGTGGYLVNELQTLFGHVQDYICAVKNVPGRYIFRNKHWIFEEGDFNTNESYDLRLNHAIAILEKKQD